MPAPSVIVNADDFGLHTSVNAAIANAAEHGIVRSASIMPRGAAFLDAVSTWHMVSHLDLGLHFTLVGLANQPETVREFLAKFSRGEIRATAVDEALRRELDFCIAVHELPISHVDSHMHMHVYPTLMRLMGPILEQYKIRKIRIPDDGPVMASVPIKRRAEAAALKVAAKVSRRIMREHNLYSTDHFLGMAVSGHLTPKLMMEYLKKYKSGSTEIVCHPAEDNGPLATGFQWGYDWETELRAVLEQEVVRFTRASHVNLISWKDLPIPE